MQQGFDPGAFVERVPDERLLVEELVELPEAVGRPKAIAPSRTRGRLVGDNRIRARERRRYRQDESDRATRIA